MPSLRESQDLFHFRSSRAATHLVEKLFGMGMPSKDAIGRLRPRHTFFGRRVLGTIQPGFPSSAAEELGDTIDRSELLNQTHDATSLVKAQGDLLIDAGIFNGDLVLVGL